MAIEYEVKFSITREQLSLLCREYGHHALTLQMETVYYDTPEGDLSSMHYTLRRREENGRSICTLKVPAPENGRLELETECSDIHKAIDTLCQLGAPENFPVLVSKGLIPVCGARFTRLAVDIFLPNTRVELALDSGVLLGGNESVALCEAEVEFKEGSLEEANRFAQELAQRYNLSLEPRSKFQRALALYRNQKGDCHGVF